MNQPRITFLIHGGPESIEAARARGLVSQYPADNVRLLFREGTRASTARRWRANLHAHPPGLVYVVKTALPGSGLALWERLLHRIPFVIDTGDVIYEMARRSGINAGWRLPVLRLVERSTQGAARAIVVRGTRHREYLTALGYTDVTLIRDGFMPTPPVATEHVEKLRAQLALTDAFVIGVIGSLNHSPRLNICYGWDLIRAIAELADLPVRGLIVGDGPGRPWLEQQARAYGVSDRIVFTGRIPYDTVPQHLQLMDVALSTQTNNLPGQVRTTGKLVEYMATGRFILASRVGEAALILPEVMLLDYEGEVDDGYPTKLAERVRSLVLEPELLDARLKLPALAERLCSYQVLSAQFNELIASL